MENPNHGYFYNQHSHRLVHTCRKSPPLNLFVFVIAVKYKSNKLVPATIIKSLLKSGANVNTTTYNGWCALISALIADHHNCAQYLIESGSDVNIHVRSRRSKKNNFCVPRKSALGFAADIGNIDTLKLLLQSGVHKHGVFIYSTTKKDVKAILEAAGACSLDSNADFSLQNQCRKAIRRHLLETSPPVNLYYKIRQLGLPSPMEHYLLYNVPALSR